MRLLVTGGCGFIGSNFIRYMLQNHKDCIIINLDKLTYAGNPENLREIEGNPNYKFVKGDICDSRIVNELAAQVDAIVNFAAESHVDRSIENSAEFVRTNVLGTQVLLDAALRHGKKRFHQISTDEVYGSLGKEGYFNEETPYDPRSPYSASKAAADYLVRAYFHTHRLPVTISNCSNNYGHYQFPEKLIPLFITNLMEGKKVPVYGQGMNVRDWLHVTDHCAAVDLILQKGDIGETYCIGGGCEKTNMQITHLILEKLNKGKEFIEYVPDRKGHDFRYAIDFKKIKNALGWEPEYGFDEGISETIRFYVENPAWWQKLKSRNQK